MTNYPNPHDPAGPPRRSPFTARALFAAATAALFTVIQFWAVLVVLGQVHVDGVVRVALAIALSGAVLAVLDGWRGVLRSGRATAATGDAERDPEPGDYFEHKTRHRE